MKKAAALGLILFIILSIAGCSDSNEVVVSPTQEPMVSEVASTAVTGRIIEIKDNEHIIIRNEEDTSIYYRLDISGGLKVNEGVNSNLQPNNVISADVEMKNSDTIPQETVLISVTENKAPDYRVIDAEEAKAIIDKGGALVVDVRTRVEYEEGYIPDAFNVPLDQIDKGIKNVTDDKDATILLYCRSGNRSKVAARILTEIGYTNVYDFGGIVNWPYDIIEP